MSTVTCSACGHSQDSIGRFCGSCGASMSAPRPASVDPLGRPAVRAQTLPPPEAPAAGSTDDGISQFGIPSLGSRRVSASSASETRVDWVSGARIAAVALAPIVLVGVILGLIFTLQGLPATNLIGGIGMVATVAFGSTLTIFVQTFFTEEVRAIIDLSPLLLPVVTTLLLALGLRRSLGTLRSAEPVEALRAMTPPVVVFVAGGTILSLLTVFARVLDPNEFAGVTVGGDFVVVLLTAGLCALVAMTVAYLGRNRSRDDRAHRIWAIMSAPIFGAVLLLTVVGVLMTLLSVAAALIQGVSGWALIATAAAGVLFLPNVALGALAFGTFSPQIGAVSGDIGDITLPAQVSGGYGLADALGDSIGVALVFLVIVNLLGVVAAAAMILRRRQQEAARRDFGVWLGCFFVLGVVAVMFFRIGVGVEIRPGGFDALWETSGEVFVATSGVAVLLLPIFAALWWILASLLLPRLPVKTLTTMSRWARIGVRG